MGRLPEDKPEQNSVDRTLRKDKRLHNDFGPKRKISISD